MKTQPNARAFSTFCLSAGAQRSKVGEIIWLARTRDQGHPIASRVSGRVSDVSGTDVSPKKVKIQKKPHSYLIKMENIATSSKSGRYVMTAMCRLFRNCIGGGRY